MKVSNVQELRRCLGPRRCGALYSCGCGLGVSAATTVGYEWRRIDDDGMDIDIVSRIVLRIINS